LKVLRYLSSFYSKNFFDLILDIHNVHFSAFLLEKPSMGLFCDNLGRKKVENMTFKFLITVNFHVFSKIFITYDIISQ
jgi:hypothetical protein